jgi:O-antigen/teichoic acid export membrane protein
LSTEQSIPVPPQQKIPAISFKQNLFQTAKGTGIVASGRLFAYGIRFILAFLLARALGADQYGLYTLALRTTAIIAGLAVLGLHTALVRYIAILSKEKDEASLWGVLQLGIGLPTLVSSFLATGLFALAYVVADRVYHRPDLAPLLQLMAIAVPFMTLGTVLAGATQGFKKMQYSVIAKDFTQVMVRLVLTIALVVSGFNALQAIAIFGLANIVSAILLVLFLNKVFPLRRSLRSAKHNRREILTFSLPVWISGLLRIFRANIQFLMLGTFYTAAGVGVFAVVARVNLIGRVAFNSINTSAKPIIAELHAQKDWAQLANIYQATGRWAFTLNLPIFLTLMLFSEAILSIFGKEFVSGAMAMRILAISELTHVGTGICGTIIDMTGHTRIKVANSTIQLVLAIGANILLIPRWGLLGAAVGTLIVIAVINNLRMVEVWYLYRILPYNRTYLKPILAALASLAVALLVKQFFSNNLSLIILAVQVALIFGVYAAVLLLLGLPAEERAIVSRLGRRIARMVRRSK